MTQDRDPRFSPANEPDDDFEDDAPRSIFSATWFRVVLVVLVLGVIGAVAIPYVLDATHDGGGAKTASAPSASQSPASSASARPATPPPAPSTPASAPASSQPASAPPLSAVSPPAPTPKAPAVVTQAPKPEAPKPETSAPPAKKEPVREAPKAETPAATKAPAAAEKAARPTPTRGKVAEGGDYFVQVGAFKDADTAKRVATRLREQNYPVDESVKRVAGAATSAPSAAPRPVPRGASPSGPDRYDVIVSGGSASEINAKLAAKGLASEPLADGVRIRPSLSLRDAVALSKDLGNEGFKVQVRRGGSAAEPAPAVPAPAASRAADGDAQTLYRVRVGGYPDRATALGVLRELQDKGYQPFIAKGRD